MAYVGCPNCEGLVAIKPTTISVICSHCNKSFKSEDAVEPKAKDLPNRSAAIHGEETKRRGEFRGSMENMATDSSVMEGERTRAQNRGASSYKWRNTYRDR